jgi:hypothetical protein
VYEVIINDEPVANVVSGEPLITIASSLRATIHLAGAEHRFRVNGCMGNSGCARRFEIASRGRKRPKIPNYVFIDQFALASAISLLTINAFRGLPREAFHLISVRHYALEGSPASQLLSHQYRG